VAGTSDVLPTETDGLLNDSIDAFLDDYACLTDGLLSLYEATFEPRWLQEASRLAADMTKRFKAPDGKGLFLTSGSTHLIHRPKEYYDNATPSGNSAAARSSAGYAQPTAARVAGLKTAVLHVARRIADLVARTTVVLRRADLEGSGRVKQTITGHGCGSCVVTWV
jgi:uncharacterized protein YyaL (SSP411 family)